ATSRAPNTEASGPTRSWPTGIATNDPNASYDQSRDCSSLGTFSCIAVVQPMPNTSPPVPARNIRTTRACLLNLDAVVGDDRGEDDASEVGDGVLVIPGCDSAPLLQSAEGAFGRVAVPVQVGIECGWTATRPAFS